MNLDNPSNLQKDIGERSPLGRIIHPVYKNIERVSYTFICSKWQSRAYQWQMKVEKRFTLFLCVCFSEELITKNLKYMKRHILLLIVCFYTFINSGAQINRNIGGVTIGVSTPQNVISVLKGKHINYVSERNGTVLRGNTNVSFAGIIWDEVCYVFINNVVYKIVYTKSDKGDRHECVLNGVYLRDNLRKKYNQYYSPIFPNGDDYTDGKTNVSLVGGQPVPNAFLSIHYTDAAQVKESLQQDYNDL